MQPKCEHKEEINNKEAAGKQSGSLGQSSGNRAMSQVLFFMIGGLNDVHVFAFYISKLNAETGAFFKYLIGCL
jgi:hypothetical protein